MVETKTEKVAVAAVPPEGTCAVDIRVFLLTITLAMSAAFLAGISVHLPLEGFLQRPAAAGAAAETKSALPLNPADLVTAGPHSPSGQHILVDMRGIEADFLDSEERLALAMVTAVEESGLTMLSYHCHKLDPAGISCVGILLESHISFHTWPEEGVITLDLFTCGANPLLPAVAVIQRLFGIGENIDTKWSHDLRGFRSIEERKKNYLDEFSDLSVWILSPMEMHKKIQIYSNLTKHQRVDIWDLVEVDDTPSHADGIKHNIPEGDDRWFGPEYYTPDRILFLDGTIQSLYTSESTYHEALVHPAMFAHQGPKRVAVLGGGEGATIREVLKHKTVESVTMIELDEELMAICREYLPKMSDCSDIPGRADNCFDDDILSIDIDNAVDYFHTRYGPGKDTTTFDVLIVDALDPEEEVVFAVDLYADDQFISSILRSLADDGVLLIQIGTAPDILDPKADIGSFSIREKLFNLFEGHADVASMHVYEEDCGFLEPHSFLVVCKDISCRNRWNARTDAVDYEIFSRILPTKSGKNALEVYDGATQHKYQVPPMAWESVYCRREPTPVECEYRSLDLAAPTHELSLNEGEGSFTVETKTNAEGQVVGTSVFASVGIAKGSYIMPEHLAKSLLLDGAKIRAVGDSANNSHDFAELAKFIGAKSHKVIDGSADFHVLEIGGPTLIRKVNGGANVGPWVPTHPSGKRPLYSPVYDRHSMSFEVFLVATEDIPAGTELTRVA